MAGVASSPTDDPRQERALDILREHADGHRRPHLQAARVQVGAIVHARDGRLDGQALVIGNARRAI
jgi:hypothetical protein